MQPVIRVKNVKAVIPTGFSERLGVDTATAALLRVEVNNGGVVFARINVTHVANKVPGFSFSRYFTQLALNNDILISLENYRNIFEDIQTEIESSQNDAFIRRFYESYNSTVVEKSKY